MINPLNCLTELLAPYRTISIIGMAKNTGKTTTLNHLIRNFHKQNVKLALTSIGRDGEQVDIVTKTAKPEIFVYKGTLIATAEKLLSLCDITKEILKLTDINTPMGRVVIVRALSDGFVQLGGASITTQISSLFENFQADKIIVDGAVSRKSLANPGVTEAAILCTGAGLSRSLNMVIDETRHAVRMLTLPKLEDARIFDEVQHLTEYVQAIDKGYIYFPGAVSDAVVHNLIVSNTKLENVCLIAEDPSKIFIKPGTYEKLLLKKAALMVKTPINLAAVTVNPVSPYDMGFETHGFLEQMREAVSIPVFDVMMVD